MDHNGSAHDVKLIRHAIDIQIVVSSIKSGHSKSRRSNVAEGAFVPIWFVEETVVSVCRIEV